MVCIWNGSSVERAAVMEAAKVYGAKTCFFENGLLPNTTTLDPKGVNAAGILSEKTADFFYRISICFIHICFYCLLLYDKEEWEDS